MRPSKRSSILEAANRVAERDGMMGITIDSVAEEAGLTKGGVIYHFPTKESLMTGVQEHLAKFWEAAMTLDAGKTAQEASIDERVAAYTRVAMMSSSVGADLAVILENAQQRADDDPAWATVAQRWTPNPDEAAADSHILDLFIVCLATDGLWAFESLRPGLLDPEFRRIVAQRLAWLAEYRAPDQPSSDGPTP